jgi:hypothetical protein
MGVVGTAVVVGVAIGTMAVSVAKVLIGAVVAATAVGGTAVGVADVPNNWHAARTITIPNKLRTASDLFIFCLLLSIGERHDKTF